MLSDRFLPLRLKKFLAENFDKNRGILLIFIFVSFNCNFISKTILFAVIQ